MYAISVGKTENIWKTFTRNFGSFVEKHTEKLCRRLEKTEVKNYCNKLQKRDISLKNREASVKCNSESIFDKFICFSLPGPTVCCVRFGVNLQLKSDGKKEKRQCCILRERIQLFPRYKAFTLCD